MTAARTTRTARGWLTGHDPGLAALRRALRVTVAACVGFFLAEYVLGLSTLATYAVFGAIAVGVLSDVGGPPAQRTRTFLAAIPVGLVLVAIGTAVAQSTPAAVVGMLVVGFAVAYAGVGGPRIAGLANGLQLFYVLPCFPPYDPGSLPQRLAGLVIGIGLVAAADRLLWPAGAPASFRERLADAVDVVARYVTDLPAEGPGKAADAAVTGLRAAAVPAAVRPTGPGLRDRGLTHAAAELRTMVVRAHLLAGFLPDLHNDAAQAAADTLLAVVGDTLARCAAALRGTGPPPESGPVVAGIADYIEGRADRITDRIGGDELPPVLRVGGLTAAVGEAARGLVAGVRAGIGAPPDATADAPASAWYLGLPTAVLWWRRLAAHATPRSVYFQNAVRLALGLAAARLAADLLDLSHGFWVLLATLSLMRTSLVASGLALVPAFLGTLGGAFVAAGVLAFVGDDTVVYAVVLPIAMLVSFAAGPLLGPAAGQFGFTVVVSVLFAQLAPTTWRIAEVRLTDVVIGGLIGALIGAAVWPRGGSGEIRRSAAMCLRSAADDLVATVRALAGVPSRESGQHRMRPDPAHRVTVLFDITYAQYRSEPARDQSAHDWLDVLAVVQRASADAEILRDRYPAPEPLPWPAVSRRLVAAAEDIARAFREAAGALEEHVTDPPDRRLAERLDADPPRARFADDPHATLRVVDAWGWMHGLSADLARTERAAAHPGSR